MASGQVVVTITGNATQLSAVLGGAARDLEGFRAKMAAVGTKMTTIGKGLTFGLTLPIVGLGVAGFKSAQDFESAFAGVEKTVEGTKAQMGALRQGIIDMSKELPASTTEIAAVAEAAGALGIATEDVLGFTRVMIDLSETTDLTADQAATSLAQFANIVGLAGDEYDELGSTIVDLGNDGASTESQIVEMAQRIAGAGRQVGLTTPQILGIASALANVGIEAEAGGTAISRTFIEMATAVERGGEAVAGFATVAGVSAEEFAEKFRVDAAGAMVDFITGLQRIQESGGSVLLTLDELGITEIRQRDAILRLVGSQDNLVDSLGTANTAWGENNALTEEARKRYETNAAKMKILKNRLNDVLRIMGEALIPVIEKAAGWLTTLAEKWQGLSDGTQKWVLIVGGIVAVVAPVLIILGALATAIATIGFPILLIGAVIIGLGVLLTKLGVDWAAVWAWIKRAASDAWTGIIQPVFNALVGAVNWVKDVALPAMRGVWSAVWADLGRFADEAGAIIGPVFAGIIWAAGILGAAISAAAETWGTAWRGMSSVIGPVANTIIGVIGAIIDTIRTLIRLAGNAADALGSIGSAVGGSFFKSLPGVGPIVGIGEGIKGIFGAEGGVINRPTMLLAGEAGPEALIPLHKSRGNGPLPQGFGSGTLIIPISIGGRAVAEVVVSELNRAGGPKIKQSAVV